MRRYRDAHHRVHGSYGALWGDLRGCARCSRGFLQATKGGTSDYADGFSGGPDYWDVANLSRGETLNVRSEPGTGKEIIGTLSIGDRVRNLGCKPSGSGRWCKIEAGLKQKFTGWVNGKYLREAAAPPQGATYSNDAM